ncbi:hypothetical protein [Desulfopila sp. IMCC35008]|uniref:hypothetical protein n=1 Tax=Desulfopila sp. IMCC35008 TaxID=2653858 RepID=UPI0013D8176B|nr:hypothetical protein [Desulfopila sp. IMCC35008]
MTLQEQYNLVPGNYAKEMASISVWPHLKSMVAEVAELVGKQVANLRSTEQKSEG